MHSLMGVVVIFMNAGFGGSIQPRKKRKRGWLPKGIMDSITQKMALLCRSRYSLTLIRGSSDWLKKLGKEVAKRCNVQRSATVLVCGLVKFVPAS